MPLNASASRQGVNSVVPTVYLIEGPVGAGKSTHAIDLAKQVGGVHVALDEWFTRLYSPDRPLTDVISWYAERKKRLVALIWLHAKAILNNGTDVILELGLIQRVGRLDFCAEVTDDGWSLTIHVLDAPIEVRRDRIQNRNVQKGQTFSMVVPADIFELASRLWESPDDEECSMFNVQFVDGA